MSDRREDAAGEDTIDRQQGPAARLGVDVADLGASQGTPGGRGPDLGDPATYARDRTPDAATDDARAGEASSHPPALAGLHTGEAPDQAD